VMQIVVVVVVAIPVMVIASNDAAGYSALTNYEASTAVRPIVAMKEPQKPNDPTAAPYCCHIA
jgi:hypothetical protein